MCETLVGSAAERYESVNNKLRIYKRSEKLDEAVNVGGGLLSQNQIDEILGNMLEEDGDGEDTGS